MFIDHSETKLNIHSKKINKGTLHVWNLRNILLKIIH